MDAPMGILKRPPIDPEWRDRAVCKEYDPELWSIGDYGEEGHEEAARAVCVEECPVREDCLRSALQTDSPPTYGVVRGGHAFTGGRRIICRRCKYLVAMRRNAAVCVVCENYDLCTGMCGRMVSKLSDSGFCRQCKWKEEAYL